MSITEIAVKRPSLIIVIFTILTIGGYISYQQLGYELMPKFNPPVMTITTIYPGASPSEVASSVTEKLEDALSGLEDVKEMTSKSLEGFSFIIIEFKQGINLDVKSQDAQRKVENIIKDLPTDILAPSYAKLSPNDAPILQVSATSNMVDKEFYQLMIDEILPLIQQAKGVAEISILGGEQREIRINVNKDKLKFYNLSLLQVTQAISQANLDFPTGRIKTTGEQVTVRLAGKFKSLSEIKELVVFSPSQGSPIRVSDVADVFDGIRDIESVSRYNGKNGIGLLIKKQGDANAVETSKVIREQLKKIESKYQKQKLLFIVDSDNSIVTLAAAEAVAEDLLIAVFLVAAVMLLFLHSLRNAFIVMVAIPASLVSTLIAMYAFDYTLNLMTLLAMSLVVGILVDDSIVVLENIYRHLEMGKDNRQAALDGRSEISFTAISITMVDVVVFLPITFVESTIANILRQFSVMVVVSTLMSLFVSFTITPWLASRFSKLEKLNPRNPFQFILIWFEKGLDAFTNGYVQLVKFGLKYKFVVIAFIIFLFYVTIQVMQMGIVGQELVAQGDQGKFLLRLEYAKNTSVLQNNLSSKAVENFLLSKPEVSSVFSNIAGPSSGISSIGVGSAFKTEFTVSLVPKEKRSIATEEYMKIMRRKIQETFAGVDVSVNIVGLVNSGGAPIEIILSGENYDEVLATGEKLKKAITNVPGANDVQVSVEAGNPEVRIDIDREKMSKLDLNISTVGATLQNSLAGNDDSKYREGDSEYTIRVMLDAFDRKNPEDVKEISFINAKGQSIKLSQFANVYRSTGPSILERKNRRKSVTVTAYTIGLGSGTVGQNIDKIIQEQKILPPSVDLMWGGDVKRQKESFGSLGIALLVGIILVYLIMVALYDSFIYPFVVLFSIPVALIGAFLALNLSSSSFSIFTMLGILMLLGLVSKNAILIVDFANHIKTQGTKTRDALLEAVKERMRPILMTTIAMVIGMLPIALAKGAGAEWKNGLAWVLIGGLTSSMFLTIVLVPVIYESVDSLQAFIGRLRGKKKTDEPSKNEVTEQEKVLEEV